MSQFITRERKYKGRTVRVIACNYVIAHRDFGPIRVSGWAVDAGQIPRFAVRQVESAGWWQSDDWDTGRSITLHGGDMDDAIAQALDKLAQIGEAKYRECVARSVWPSPYRYGVAA